MSSSRSSSRRTPFACARLKLAGGLPIFFLLPLQAVGRTPGALAPEDPFRLGLPPYLSYQSARKIHPPRVGNFCRNSQEYLPTKIRQPVLKSKLSSRPALKSQAPN